MLKRLSVLMVMLVVILVSLSIVIGWSKTPEAQPVPDGSVVYKVVEKHPAPDFDLPIFCWHRSEMVDSEPWERYRFLGSYCRSHSLCQPFGVKGLYFKWKYRRKCTYDLYECCIFPPGCTLVGQFTRYKYRIKYEFTGTCCWW